MHILNYTTKGGKDILINLDTISKIELSSNFIVFYSGNESILDISLTPQLCENWKQTLKECSYHSNHYTEVTEEGKILDILDGRNMICD